MDIPDLLQAAEYRITRAMLAANSAAEETDVVTREDHMAMARLERALAHELRKQAEARLEADLLTEAGS